MHRNAARTEEHIALRRQSSAVHYANKRQQGGSASKLEVPLESHPPFDFIYLIPVYGKTLAIELSRAWTTESDTIEKAGTKKKYYRLKQFLLWVSRVAAHDDRTYLRDLSDQLSSGSLANVKVATLQACVDLYREVIAAASDKELTRTKSKRTHASILDDLRGALRRLVDSGHLSDGVTVAGGIALLFGMSSTKCLAELSQRSGWQHIEAVSIVYGSLQEIHNLNFARLSAIRDCAEGVLKQEYEYFRKGRIYLQQTLQLDVVGVSRTVNRIKYEGGSRSDVMAAIPEDEAIACAVQYIANQKAGLLHVTAEPEWFQIFAGYIGAQTLRAHLEATPKAYMAAQTVVICDTGLNLGVVNDQLENPFFGSVIQGNQRITSAQAHKLRAGGKVIESELIEDLEAIVPVKRVGGGLSSVDAINIYREMSSPLRARATGNSESKYLWVLPTGTAKLNSGPIERPSEVRQSILWQRFRVEHGFAAEDGPQSEEITRHVLRRTALQVKATKGGVLDFFRAKAEADHASSSTTFLYLSSNYIRRELARQVREFQTQLEAVLISGTTMAPIRLGVSKALLSAVSELGQRNGLGPLCVSSYNEAQDFEAKTAGKKQAPARVKSFIASDEEIRRLIIRDLALTDAQSRMELSNVDRWIAIFIPFMAVVTAIKLKLLAGPLKLRYLRIEKDISAELAAGTLQLPYIA